MEKGIQNTGGHEDAYHSMSTVRRNSNERYSRMRHITPVIINSLIFIVFAFSFTWPKTSWDCRSLGGFAAFIVALFTEMSGFPLTIYLLSGWLERNEGQDTLAKFGEKYSSCMTKVPVFILEAG